MVAVFQLKIDTAFARMCELLMFSKFSSNICQLFQVSHFHGSSSTTDSTRYLLFNISDWEGEEKRSSEKLSSLLMKNVGYNLQYKL